MGCEDADRAAAPVAVLRVIHKTKNIEYLNENLYLASTLRSVGQEICTVGK
jgi:hypothetical protein